MIPHERFYSFLFSQKNEARRDYSVLRASDVDVDALLLRVDDDYDDDDVDEDDDDDDDMCV